MTGRKRYKVVLIKADGTARVWSDGYPSKKSAQQAAVKLNRDFRRPSTQVRFTVEEM